VKALKTHTTATGKEISGELVTSETHKPSCHP